MHKATKMKKLAEAAQKAQDEKALAKKQKPVANKAAEAEKKFYKKALKLIEAAASKGQYECSLPIYEQTSRMDHILGAACDLLKTHLEEEGFKVERHSTGGTIECMETGYGNYKMPVYTLKLTIEWF